MKVVMINAPSDFLISDRDQPPMGLLSIAAYLREHGHEVCVADLAGVPEACWFIPEGDFYGITATTPQYPCALRIRSLLEGRKGKTVIGGYHATSLPKRTLVEGRFDYVVIGEGEYAMLDIVEGRADPGFVHGRLADVNTIPRPAWDMLDIHDYAKIGTNSWLGPSPKGRNKEGYIQAIGRGCPYDCSFCGQAVLTQRKARYMDPQRTVEWMAWWVDRVGVDRFYLFDDTFTINHNRIREFCRVMYRAFGRDVDWHCLSTVKDLSPEIMVYMRDYGCKGITFGIESLSDRVLLAVDETMKMRADRNVSMMQHVVKFDMGVRCQLIVGLPGETRDTINETAARIRDLPSSVIIGIHILVPLPGSRIWNNLAASGFPHINPDTVDFSNFCTIGKPDHPIRPLHQNWEEVLEWRQMLVEAAGERNIATYAQRRLHK